MTSRKARAPYLCGRLVIDIKRLETASLSLKTPAVTRESRHVSVFARLDNAILFQGTSMGYGGGGAEEGKSWGRDAEMVSSRCGRWGSGWTHSLENFHTPFESLPYHHFVSLQPPLSSTPMFFNAIDKQNLPSTVVSGCCCADEAASHKPAMPLATMSPATGSASGAFPNNLTISRFR
ncbi:hypothetical protein MIND_01374300 [Mycena indigotica]|uniref:Uncharacterized protein n=1 Tax=Mycena indigotica TaxID=2126181 RepID=A0A8H6RYQ7_9AGAR|nr:uncharacterized protein MIND_01374300 [Mycena indigotica]KAF7289133.1 hypothetical protein MIND_01374300 [Mycena indigotica]